MASHAFEGMNDFFDFDRLEHDLGTAVSASALGPESVDNIAELSPVVCMDWVADGAAEVSTSRDSGMPHACGFDSASHAQSAQWPLPAAVQQLTPGVGDGRMDLHFMPHLGDVSIAGDTAPGQQLLPHVMPSSSSLSYGSQELASDPIDIDSNICGGQQTSLPTLAMPGLETTDASVSAKKHEPTPALTAMPLRQPSTSSWKPASAKRKGPQIRIPLEARQILEDEFVANPYPCSWEMDIIAHQANLDVKKVRNWFNNTRARKMDRDVSAAQKEHVGEIGCLSGARLSRESLEALEQQAMEGTKPPQPLAVYLAQSYQEESVQLPDVQTAIATGTLSSSADVDEAWAGTPPRGRTGSIITSVASSDGTAPTSFTVSSSGSCSNISSFGRDRRRGRRRMAWKESPHNNRPKFDGVDSAGEPQKDLSFFCTFCPRAFKTKYEWVRHEDSVHALRTTWICCETNPALLETCPFCGHMHPDDAHMAGHKYQQCSNKPASQRTFYRRDHFIQHLHHLHFANSKHPSVRVGCQARLMATEGHNFGCKDLAIRWRRFGAPMKQDDPMLHCGMCGKKSKDWSERCEHVAQHLLAREHDRSAWWSERKENHLENLYSASPFESFRCRYCLKIFTDVKEMNAHSHCKVWSCRFLKTFDDVTVSNAGPPLCSDFPSAKAHHCHLCGAGYRTPHSEHAQNYHRYRSCNQELYTSEESFLAHLHNFHAASHPTLLQGSSVIEQSFLRNKGASFEPVEFNESWQPCLMDLDETTLEFAVDKTSSTINQERKDNDHVKRPTPARKKVRESSGTTTSKTEAQGPRFFRLSTYVPFLSSRILYSRNGHSYSVPRDSHAVLEELNKPNIASLVMSSGVIGMALGRWFVRPNQSSLAGVIEFSIDEEDWPS